MRPSLTFVADSCLPAITYIQTIYVMAMNTATDFFLMSIPLPVSILPQHSLFILKLTHYL